MPLAVDLLRVGGVFSDMVCTDPALVLRDLVDRLPLQKEKDRHALTAALEARERVCSTAVGDGIAFPHAPRDVGLDYEGAFVALGLLHDAINFAAPDGKPVYAFFVVWAPQAQTHLAALAHLGWILRDPTFRTLLKARARPVDILERAEFIELQLEQEK